VTMWRNFFHFSTVTVTETDFFPMRSGRVMQSPRCRDGVPAWRRVTV
jgi:hypothetical protein